MRTAHVVVIGAVLGFGLALEAPAARAAPPKAPTAPKPEVKTAAQKEAERHFQSGVQLFKETKYAEALAEFERAYEISPQPLVLYNIAGCHRELSHYSEAVAYYRRFLTEGKDKAKPARLAAAQAELDGILARIARVTVTVTPGLSGVSLILDGTPIDKPEMPLILPPGEHRLVARAEGRPETERSVRVASGDELAVELVLAERPPPPPERPPVQVIERGVAEPDVSAGPKHIAVSAGFGTNALRTRDSGAPWLGLGFAIGSRVELGVDVMLVAFAAIPSVRVRLAGDAFSVHVVGAVPISINDGPMTSPFASGALGLGVRYQATPAVAFRLESLVSYAGKTHGTTVPTFLGGELWF
jgi:hypothetical protein